MPPLTMLSHAQLQRLTLAELLISSEFSAPLSPAASLNERYTRAFGAQPFPQQLHDAALLAEVKLALASDQALAASQAVFPSGTPLALTVDDRAAVFARLSELAMDAHRPGWLQTLRNAPDGPYRALNLAQTLWHAGACTRPRDALYIAVLALYDRLPDTPAPAPAVMAPRRLSLDGYLDASAASQALIDPDDNRPAVEQIFSRWGMGLFLQGGADWRLPTRQEREDAVPLSANGRRFIYGTLQPPPATVLNALLAGERFTHWQAQVAEALQWKAGAPLNRNLAEQLLLDTLWPPQEHRPGYLLAFNLFAAERRHDSFDSLRLDLYNSVQASLDSSPALAQLASTLLIRHYAPELLIDHAPTGFTFIPDLRWANLRHGARILQDSAQPLTFKAAETALSDHASRTTRTDPLDLLGDTYLQWAALNGLLDEQGPYTPEQNAFAYWRWTLAWAFEALSLPDRIAQAQRNLSDAGLKATEINAYLQHYLHGHTDLLPAHARAHLPDINAWFEAAFSAYLRDAQALYRPAWALALARLPSEHRARLAQQRWSAYALTWPRYTGPVQGGIPSPSDSPPEHWQEEVASEGLVLHLQSPEGDWLYQCFPLNWEWRIAPAQDAWSRTLLNDLSGNLELLIAPDYHDYNGRPRPWGVGHRARGKHLFSSEGALQTEAMAACYAKEVALGQAASLRQQCRGATPYEITRDARLQESHWRYLWRLIKRTVPLATCVDTQDASDVASCLSDVLLPLANGIKAGRRLARPLVKLANTHTASARASHRQLVAAVQAWQARTGVSLPAPSQQWGLGARAWRSSPHLTHPAGTAPLRSVDGAMHPVAQDEQAQWRLLDPHSETPFGPPLSPADELDGALFSSATQPFPGQTPALIDPLPEPNTLMAIAFQRTPHVTDVLVRGEPYRSTTSSGAAKLLHSRHAPPPTRGPLPMPTLNNGARSVRMGPPLALPPSATDGTLISRAVVTREITPARVAFRPHDLADGRTAEVFIHDNKVLQHSEVMKAGNGGYPPRGTQRWVTTALDPEQAQWRLGLSSPPQYHRQIMAELHPNTAFGFDANTPANVVARANLQCPVLRLGGIAKSVADRRILRGIQLQWKGENWLLVEADLGIFYGTRYPLDGLPTTPLRLLRIRDVDAIHSYLEISETYRVVATRPNLQSDIENVTQLLDDWLFPTSPFMPIGISPFQQHMRAYERALLPIYARNVLTRSGAQNSLAAPFADGIPGISREIIPHWSTAAQRPIERQLHIIGVLNNLLPANGTTRTAYFPLSLQRLGDAEVARALSRHIGGANLAFVSVTLKDGQRRVYYALSGGKSHQAINLQAPLSADGASIRYIDSRARMAGQPIDPRFTELPSLRTAEHLNPKQHQRHLDAERLIASVINQDLLKDANSVASLEVFTLYDTCRSCGGFVLPRLRLDYPRADFSVCYLLEYKV